MGRTLQKQRRLEKQIAIFMPLLEGLDGIEKMVRALAIILVSVKRQRSCLKR